MCKNSLTRSELKHGIGPVNGQGQASSSALADALKMIKPSIRQRFGISDNVIAFLEVLVAVVRCVLDEGGNRPWFEKLDELDLDASSLDLANLSEVVDFMNKAPAQAWTKRLKSPQGRAFFRRLLGAAAFDRVDSAMREDGALLVIATRRGLRALMPVAVALDSCASVLSPEQMRGIKGITSLTHSALHIAYELDSVLDRVLDQGLPLEHIPVRPDELRALETDLETLSTQIGHLVADRSEERVAALSLALARKIRGAKQVLQVSDDGVSQAANSLIEFMDRLLRRAFTEDFVCTWIQKNCADTAEMTYVADGVLKPTKQGQALCFAHGGREVEEESTFHQIAALGLATSRKRLQKLKHSDKGSAEEVAEVELLLRAVEGFFLFSIYAGWSLLAEERLDELKERLK